MKKKTSYSFPILEKSKIYEYANIAHFKSLTTKHKMSLNFNEKYIFNVCALEVFILIQTPVNVKFKVSTLKFFPFSR